MKLLEVFRAAYGVTEICAPRWGVGMLLGRAPDRKTAAVIRVLGARHLIQALMTHRKGQSAHRIGGTVDLLHAASMVGIAVRYKKHRSPALLSAAIAAVFGVGEFL
jgi:uncharacterized membrane protein